MRKVKLLFGNKEEAYFHQFGLTSVEVDGGSLTDTVAIVELEDGSVTTVEVDSFAFLDKPNIPAK